jgi:hypothetical protein
MSGNTQAPPNTGIVAPRVPFVFPDGTLTPLSWRFLLGLWKNVGDQAAKTPPAAATRTGTSTTDGSGNFTATWPAFSSVFMSLTISTTDPVYPGGIVAPTSITLGSYTGTLSTTDNLYPTPSSVVQAGVTFGWIVSGY